MSSIKNLRCCSQGIIFELANLSMFHTHSPPLIPMDIALERWILCGSCCLFTPEHVMLSQAKTHALELTSQATLCLYSVHFLSS